MQYPLPSRAPVVPAQPFQLCSQRVLGLSQCHQRLLSPNKHPCTKLYLMACSSHSPTPAETSRTQPRAAPSARLFPVPFLALHKAILSPPHLPKRGEEHRELWDTPGTTTALHKGIGHQQDSKRPSEHTLSWRRRSFSHPPPCLKRGNRSPE